MAGSRIRLGIVSCGYITGAHLRGLKILREHGFDQFEVTALSSRTAENAARWIDRDSGLMPLPAVSTWPGDPLNVRDVWVRDFQLRTPRIYTDYHDMLSEHAVDAIIVLSAVSAHYPIAMAALNAGVHVMVEKPFAITARAGMRLVELAENRGLSLGVAENVRYMEGTRASGWAIRTGLIGKVQMVLAGGIGNVWSPDRIVARTAWRHQKNEAGGGGTMDIGAHLFDQLRYQCGEISEVSALARTIEPVRYTSDDTGSITAQTECDADDSFMALLQFHSGAIGNILFSWAGHGPSTGFEGGGAIYGERGCVKGGQIYRDGVSAPDNTLEVFKAQLALDDRARLFPSEITDGFALELGEFLNAIESGRQPETSGVEGLKDISPGLAILESSKLGRVVKISDIESCRIEEYQRDINAHWGIE